jgi:hypothetical protein
MTRYASPGQADRAPEGRGVETASCRLWERRLERGLTRSDLSADRDSPWGREEEAGTGVTSSLRPWVSFCGGAIHASDTNMRVCHQGFDNEMGGGNGGLGVSPQPTQLLDRAVSLMECNACNLAGQLRTTQRWNRRTTWGWCRRVRRRRIWRQHVHVSSSSVSTLTSLRPYQQSSISASAYLIFRAYCL